VFIKDFSFEWFFGLGFHMHLADFISFGFSVMRPSVIVDPPFHIGFDGIVIVFSIIDWTETNISNFITYLQI
jgi:hypothetical protein